MKSEGLKWSLHKNDEIIISLLVGGEYPQPIAVMTHPTSNWFLSFLSLVRTFPLSSRVIPSKTSATSTDDGVVGLQE